MPTDIEQTHPYVGFSYRPTGGSGPSAINELGLRGARPSREPSAINVLILGGSVASALAQRAEAVLRPGLAAHWSVDPATIRIVNGALGGYRAPQHLFVLLYLQILGYKFGAVILLDGFNEVALYPSEDRWLGTHPILPRNWAGRVYPSVFGRVARALDLGAETAGLERTPCRWCARVRRGALHRAARWLRARNYRLLVRSGFLSALPSANFRTRDDMFAELAGQWARCSGLIAEICEVRGIAFAHFLQPNQYLRSPDHAVPSPVYQSQNTYRAGVVDGYPKLRREGDTLRARGIDFHDLSDVLDGLPMREAYVDACCHLSDEGNAILAQELVERMPALSSVP